MPSCGGWRKMVVGPARGELEQAERVRDFGRRAQNGSAHAKMRLEECAAHSDFGALTQDGGGPGKLEPGSAPYSG